MPTAPVQLARRDVAARAVALVLGEYRDVARQHLAGVLAGDAEDLHRFRVAVRRSRSVLAVSRSVVPADRNRRAAVALSTVARLTSPVRDLDVFLPDLPGLVVRATAGAKGAGARGREELEELAAEMRTVPARQLDWALRGTDGNRLMEAWAAVADVYPIGGDPPGPHASRPIGELADEWIGAAARRARRRGRVATASDDLEHWHDLRKSLKRLRYLVGAFGSLYRDDELHAVQRPLIRLQDRIGRLQDLRVQIEIVDALRRMAAAGGRSGASELCDRVSVVLEAELDDERGRCLGAWSEYDTAEHRRALRRLTGR